MVIGMKYLVCGAGIGGCYITSLLRNNGYEVDIIDIRNTPDCRCAWGTSNTKRFKYLLKKAGYNLDEYILSKIKSIVTNIGSFRAINLATFDKLKLLKDMWNDLKVVNIKEPEINKYDLVIDATGSARAYLPPLQNDLLIPTIQIKCSCNLDTDKIYVYLSDDLTGYAWAFPIGDYWHIGAGRMDGSTTELIKNLIDFFDVKIKKIYCKCKGYIRHLPPSKCKPFYVITENGNEIVGIGEAIGCVSAVGEGNLQALESAKILLECIKANKLYEYENRITDFFKTLELEYRLVENKLNGNKISLAKTAGIIMFERFKKFDVHPLSLYNIVKAAITSRRIGTKKEKEIEEKSEVK